MSRTPNEYSKYLSGRRNALAQFKYTEDASITTSDAHRKLVLTAFLDANGDPADGRWSLVTHLCRLDSTRWGYRWLGARAERRGRRRSTVKNSHCTDIGKKLNDESRLIQKVESWKRTMTREMTNSVNHVTDSPGMQTTLGFKVAKRATFTNMSKSSSRHRLGPQTTNISSPNSSLLPPSFLSHLATSTQQPTGRHKPPSVPHNPSTSLVLQEEIRLYDGTFVPDKITESISKADASWDAGAGPGPQLNFLGLLNDSDEDDFNPLQTSTQRRIGPQEATPSRGTGAHWDPQFDVDQRVGEVAKLLDNDVGWYRTSYT